jgi:hypothetical protein
MSSTQIDQLVSQIECLTQEEQRELRRRLEQKASNGSSAKVMLEDEFENVLLSKGVISSIPARDRSLITQSLPVKVVGPPLSETIISERR